VADRPYHLRHLGALALTEEQTRTLIALLALAGFYGLMLIVLLGFVNVGSPEMSKLVGLFFGYAMALMNPIIVRYFKNRREE